MIDIKLESLYRNMAKLVDNRRSRCSYIIFAVIAMITISYEYDKLKIYKDNLSDILPQLNMSDRYDIRKLDTCELFTIDNIRHHSNHTIYFKNFSSINPMHYLAMYIKYMRHTIILYKNRSTSLILNYQNVDAYLNISLDDTYIDCKVEYLEKIAPYCNESVGYYIKFPILWDRGDSCMNIIASHVYVFNNEIINNMMPSGHDMQNPNCQFNSGISYLISRIIDANYTAIIQNINISPINRLSNFNRLMFSRDHNIVRVVGYYPFICI